MAGDDVWRLVAYCGLYCGAYANRERIPIQARVLRDSLHGESWSLFGENIFPGFSRFMEILDALGDPDQVCPGCRSGGGNPGCRIRSCCEERGLQGCALCEDAPCMEVRELGKAYPVLLADGERLRVSGVQAWVKMQERRVDRGFVYSCIRCESE